MSTESINNVSKLTPVQYDIDVNWKSTVLSAIEEDQGTLFETLQDLIELKENLYIDFCNDGILGEGEDGIAKLGELLDELQGEDCFELSQLRRQYSPDELARIALAVAQTLFSEKTWAIIQDRDGRCAVVTDTDRTMVFDFMYGQVLSALDSLALAGDPWALENGGNPNAPNSIMEAEVAALREAATTLQSDLDSIKTTLPENVIPFKK